MELQTVISEDYSAEIPQILGREFEACSLSLFLPKLSIRIEDPISKQDLHVGLVHLTLQLIKGARHYHKTEGKQGPNATNLMLRMTYLPLGNWESWS